MFRFLVKIAFVILIGLGIYYGFHRDEIIIPTSSIPEVPFLDVVKKVEDVQVVEIVEDVEDIEEVQDVEVVEDVQIPDTKNQINLAVPFTTQAPHANWALPYGEACEEASAYMVAEYYKGTVGKIDADKADKDILELIEFEKDLLGVWLDTTAQETAQLIDMYFGLQARVVENPTVEELKAELAAGRPIILPAAGRKLGNPNFSGEGPLYHMLVIKGYTETSFITNDPGTRNGQNYEYKISVIMEAMGDWNDGDPGNGAKRVIFVQP